MRSLALAVLLLLATAAFAEDWVKYYHEHVKTYQAENAKLDASTKHVVLVGDSLTEGWSAGRIKKFLPTLAPRVVNRGISSDGVGVNDRGVLHRLDESFFDCHASHAFLLIGVNDLDKSGKSVDRVAAAYEKVVKAVKEHANAPALVLLTLSPAAKKYKDLNPAIDKLNARIVEIGAATSTEVLDLHKLVADANGALPEELTTDGLHWKDGVYEKLGAEIEKIVARPPARKKK